MHDYLDWTGTYQLTIHSADVKAASGLMAKPVFPLTWDYQPVPSEIQQRIKPPDTSPIQRLGSGFWANTLLSQPLLRILSVIRDLIFFIVAIKLTPEVLHSTDHDFFRLINCEVEHQLLSYIYPEYSASLSSFNPELDLHPIEIVTRVASICFVNHLLIVSPPSSGLGRALTKHLMKAINTCKLSILLTLPKENFGPFAWALFVGAQGSLGRPERRWFVQRLARVAMMCGWQTWEQVSRIMGDYFFISGVQDLTWKSIWDEAMAGFVVSVDET